MSAYYNQFLFIAFLTIVGAIFGYALIGAAISIGICLYVQAKDCK